MGERPRNHLLRRRGKTKLTTLFFLLFISHTYMKSKIGFCALFPHFSSGVFLCVCMCGGAVAVKRFVCQIIIRQKQNKKLKEKNRLVAAHVKTYVKICRYNASTNYQNCSTSTYTNKCCDSFRSWKLGNRSQHGHCSCSNSCVPRL